MNLEDCTHDCAHDLRVVGDKLVCQFCGCEESNPDAAVTEESNATAGGFPSTDQNATTGEAEVTMSEPTTEPATEPTTEPASEPTTEPVTEPATEPTTTEGVSAL